MIYFIDKNADLIDAIEPIVKHCDWAEAFHGDIFEFACVEDCIIATASNPSFSMDGGLDAEIKKQFNPKNLEEGVIKDGLLPLITVGNDLTATDELILRCMAILYGRRWENIAVSGLGTGIGRYSIENFARMVNRLVNGNFEGVDLTGMNLQDSNCVGANFRNANCVGANFEDSLCFRANFERSVCIRANFRNSNCLGANFEDSNCKGANFEGAQIHNTLLHMQCPEEGSFVGWKKCKNDVIVKLRIPAKARRSSATSRKCRAEFVKVLEVFDATEGISIHDGKTAYKKGETVHCHKWEEDRWVECGGGIHFFLTRREAEEYKK